MKKILKPGNGPISSLVAKCECGCVFEFGYPDIEYGEYRAPKYIYYSQVKCPECGKPIYEYYDKSDRILEAFGVKEEKDNTNQCSNCADHKLRPWDGNCEEWEK